MSWPSADLNIAKQEAGESYNLPTIEADSLSKKAYRCLEKSADDDDGAWA